MSKTSEILIIGGGVIGLSLARELHKSGCRDICLVEKSSTGHEASWAAAGMLGPQAESDNADVFFELCSESRDLYPEFAASLLDETGVDIELDRTGTLYLSFSNEDSTDLQRRYDWQTKAALSVQKVSAEEARKAEPFVSPDVREALLFPNDWQVENRKLLHALRRYAELNDIRIVENVKVGSLTVEDGKIVGAASDNETFRADATVLATGAWTSLIKVGQSSTPIVIEPVRGQIVAFQTAKRLFRHVIYSPRAYIVPRFDGRILAGSTSENVAFDKSVTEAASTKLREMAYEIAPSIANLAVTDQWSGLRPFAADALPVIGEIGGLENLLVATGHYRNGILLAPLTAKLIADKLIGNVDSLYLREFGPDRFHIRGIGSSV